MEETRESGQYELITKGLQEVIGGHNLKNLLSDGKTPTIYWGTAPTGRIHVGYFVPALKLRDFVKAGCKVIILIADLHAFLDNLKCPFEKIELRSQYYIRMIKAILKRLDVDLNNVTFIKGSDYQLTKEVTLDLYKLSSLTKVSQAKHAGAEVVKKSTDPNLTSLLYPLLQALDEKYLNADAELGGIDQRKIFGYSRDFMPLIGNNRKFTHLMNPIVPGLSRKKADEKSGDEIQNKMSSSVASSKIDLLDSPESIQDNVKRTYCLDGNVDDNSALKLIGNLIFPLNGTFTVVNADDKGTNMTFDNYEDLVKMVSKGSLNGGIHPINLKNSLSKFLIEFLEPIRNEFNSEENKKLLEEAYCE